MRQRFFALIATLIVLGTVLMTGSACTPQSSTPFPDTKEKGNR